MNLLVWMCSGAGAVTLVRDGRAQCSLNPGKETGPIEKHCISELRKYVNKISGAKLPVKRRSASTQIILGTPSSNQLVKTALEDELSGLNTQGFVVRTRGGRLIIAGAGRLGLIYGTYDLLEHGGLLLGASSGVNVAGAVRMAREMGPGHTIVTILCDWGTRYTSKLFNPSFLHEKGLPAPRWLDQGAT